MSSIDHYNNVLNDDIVREHINNATARVKLLKGLEMHKYSSCWRVRYLTAISILSKPNYMADKFLFKTAYSVGDNLSLGLLYQCGIGVKRDKEKAIEYLSLVDGPLSQFYTVVKSNSYKIKRTLYDDYYIACNLEGGDFSLEQALKHLDRAMENENIFSIELLLSAIIHQITKMGNECFKIFLEYALERNIDDERLWKATGISQCYNYVYERARSIPKEIVNYWDCHRPEKESTSHFIKSICTLTWDIAVGHLGYQTERLRYFKEILPSTMTEDILKIKREEGYLSDYQEMIPPDLISDPFETDSLRQYQMSLKYEKEGNAHSADFWLRMSASGGNLYGIVKMMTLSKRVEDFRFWKGMLIRLAGHQIICGNSDAAIAFNYAMSVDYHINVLDIYKRTFGHEDASKVEKNTAGTHSFFFGKTLPIPPRIEGIHKIWNSKKSPDAVFSSKGKESDDALIEKDITIKMMDDYLDGTRPIAACAMREVQPTAMTTIPPNYYEKVSGDSMISSSGCTSPRVKISNNTDDVSSEFVSIRKSKDDDYKNKGVSSSKMKTDSYDDVIHFERIQYNPVERERIIVGLSAQTDIELFTREKRILQEEIMFGLACPNPSCHPEEDLEVNTESSVIICPRCCKQNDSSNIYCIKCGYKLKRDIILPNDKESDG